MKDFKQVLLEIIKTIIKKNKTRLVVYLEGGYYDTRFGPQDFSINTMVSVIKVADEIINKRYGVTRVVLGVLANDIGMTCSDDVCSLPLKQDFAKDENTTLPDVLKEIINRSKVSQKDQTIFSTEKTLRNRGLRLVKEIVKEPEKYSIKIDKNADGSILYNVVIDGNKIPLAIRKDNSWSARCPLIMGQYYSDLYIKFAKKYGVSSHQLLVDMGEMYDRHKMNNGAKVAFMLLQKKGYDVNNLKIVNFCFQDDGLINFEYDLTQRMVS